MLFKIQLKLNFSLKRNNTKIQRRKFYTIQQLKHKMQIKTEIEVLYLGKFRLELAKFSLAGLQLLSERRSQCRLVIQLGGQFLIQYFQFSLTPVHPNKHHSQL